MEGDKNLYVLPNDQPIVALDIASAFAGLTTKEKFYAHYISQAAWTGGLITLLQTSPESGPLWVLIHKQFSAQKAAEFKAAALKAGFTEDEVVAWLVYACGIFANSGNYKGFGDTKIIPNIEQGRLEDLLKTSPIWSELEPLWNKVKNAIYDISPGRTCLGFPPQGCTTYLSKNCTSEDTDNVQNWLKTKKIECWNSRLFKTVENDKIVYEIRFAGEQKEERSETIGNITYRITVGDYSPIIAKVADYLEQAIQYTANDNQTTMLKWYCQSFRTGSLDDHKKGSLAWIQDKGPAVENYIGFIETYRDPAGVRGEFEGFVAVVNRKMTAKFSVLVETAEKLLKLLPWSSGFEKDKFLMPDFTSLDVLTFAGSGLPVGINIPNYDDIRQTVGFKNVSLGNVLPASYSTTVDPFISKEDSDLLQKYRTTAFELQVGLHELLGHGSGKIFRKSEDGSLNYPPTLLDPLTGLPPTCAFGPGDTYDTLFGPLSSSYEECRAEAVGLYLSLDPEVLKIFGHEGQQAEDVLYVNWLSLIVAGAGRGLEQWEPGRGWKQAHAQARYVLARVLIQAGVATVTPVCDCDLLITVDRSAIKGAGRCAIGHFLLQLQVYKATGNVEAAKKLYNHYSEVAEPWLSWRSIVMAKKQPRKIYLQGNTVVENGNVKLKTYEANFEGQIQSCVDRILDPAPMYQAVVQAAEADAHHF